MRRNRESRKKSEKRKVFEFTYEKDKTPFQNLIANLEVNGFDVKEDTYLGHYATGHKIRAAVMDYDSEYWYAGFIMAERKECFDKWSRSPIIMKLPSSKSGTKYLMQKLAWLCTADGLKASRSYDTTDWIDERGNY